MKPPSEETIAYRALCLGALISRGEIEHKLYKIDDDDDRSSEIEELKNQAAELSAWLEREHLTDYQSQQECELFEKKPGSWKRQAMINAGWRTESLGTLLWVLSYLEEIPSYDTEFKVNPVLDELGVLMSSRCFIQCTLIRPTREIRHQREVSELWHWRSRTSRLMQQSAKSSQSVRVNGTIQEAAQHAYLGQNIPRPIQGDFPAFGKPYSALSPSEFAKATSIAFERHYALNWVCGYSDDWDRTPTDT